MTARRPRIGLALGSGGARGWCHVGAIRALADLGIRPDVIAGASMGALVGAALAGGGLDALEQWARGLTWRGVLRMTDLRLRGGGLVGGGHVAQVLDSIGIPARIEDLAIPFVAVATDLTTGKEVWLREGPVAPAVRASIAIPGVFAPAEIDGRWLIDGGVVNPLPVSVARAMGADVVIAINPNAEGRMGANGGRRGYWPRAAGGPAYGETVMAAIDMMTDHIRRSRLAGDPPEVMLSAELGRMGVLELHRAAEAMDEGARIVAGQAGAIRRACGV